MDTTRDTILEEWIEYNVRSLRCMLTPGVSTFEEHLLSLVFYWEGRRVELQSITFPIADAVANTLYYQSAREQVYDKAAVYIIGHILDITYIEDIYDKAWYKDQSWREVDRKPVLGTLTPIPTKGASHMAPSTNSS